MMAKTSEAGFCKKSEASFVNTAEHIHRVIQFLGCAGLDSGEFYQITRTFSLSRWGVLARDMSIATVASHGSSISNILAARIDDIRDEDPDRVNLHLSVGGQALLSHIIRR